MSLLAKLKAQRDAREAENADTAKQKSTPAPVAPTETAHSPESAPELESNQGSVDETRVPEVPASPKPALRLPLGARRPAPTTPAKVEPMPPVSGADFAEAAGELGKTSLEDFPSVGDSVADEVAMGLTEPAPAAPVRKPLGGLVRRAIVATPKPTEAQADTAPQAPSGSDQGAIAAPATKLTPPAAVTGGIIGAMKRRAVERTAEPRPAPVAVAKGAQELVAPTYSPEQMLADLQLIEQDAPADLAEEDADGAAIAEYTEQMAALNAQRAAILTKGANTIEEIFQGQMSDLQYASATDQSMATVASIVTLTFLRLKSAPNAWALMELADQAKVIAGMRAMAIKRNSIVSKKKPKEAAAMSEALDAMAALPESESLDALMGGFDLDGF